MKRTNLLILMLSLVVAVAAFFVTVGAGPGSSGPSDPHLGRLLELTDAQREAIDQSDPTFDEQAATLSVHLRDAKNDLATALEDDTSTDAQILEKVEASIAAHDELARRVARHMLLIRSHLEPQQRSRLMGLCAEGVRAGNQHRYRRGQGGGGGGHGGSGGQGRGRFRGGHGGDANP